jgi:Cu/Ag efflux pump CusA
VAESRIVGGRPPEYHVIVSPEKLNSYGLPLTKIVDAIRNNNRIAAAGMVQENYHLYLTTVTGLMRQKEQIEDTVIDVIKGTPILIKDMAQVVLGERPVYNIVTANGRPAVLGSRCSSMLHSVRTHASRRANGRGTAARAFKGRDRSDPAVVPDASGTFRSRS